MTLSHRELDDLRALGDPEADAVLAALGADGWIVNATLRHVHRNDEPLPSSVPVAVRRLFDAHVSLPPDVDQHCIARAQTFSAGHLLPILLALLYASLPTTYAAARGARVLSATGRMAGPALERRIHETAQFLVDVLTPGGFSQAGSGLRAIQKVRLMHAAVRAQLARTATASAEVAINQEDLLGTLFAFSIVVVRALRRLGIDVTAQQADDYYGLWRVAGSLLGIRARSLPVDFNAACDLSDRIAARHLQPSDHGRELMAELLAGMEQHVPSALRRAPRVLVRHLVGDDIADALDIPSDPTARAALAVARLLPRPRELPLSGIVQRLASTIALPLIGGVIGAKLGGAPPTFAMPQP